jgi:hypothetical protein
MGASTCCRAILSQRDLLKEIQERLDTTLGPQDGEVLAARARAVNDALDRLRDILGSYSVSGELTAQFRQQLEPDLANVWTLADLENYTRRIEAFAKRLNDSLRRWQEKYCKER